MTTLFTRRRLMRYLPLLLWIAFISFASTNSFSASNTSRFIRPLLVWLFPQISEERIAVFHFLYARPRISLNTPFWAFSQRERSAPPHNVYCGTIGSKQAYLDRLLLFAG